MDVDTYTIGELIDQLTIVNIKIYHLEDVKRESCEDAVVAFAARKAQALNDQRSALKNAITRRIEGATAREDIKTHG